MSVNVHFLQCFIRQNVRHARNSPPSFVTFATNQQNNNDFRISSRVWRITAFTPLATEAVNLSFSSSKAPLESAVRSQLE